MHDAQTLHVVRMVEVACKWTVITHQPKFAHDGGSDGTIRNPRYVPGASADVLKVVFLPVNVERETAERLCDETMLLGVEIGISQADPALWIPDSEAAERWAAKLQDKATGMYVGLSDGREFVFLPQLVELTPQPTKQLRRCATSSGERISFSQVRYLPDTLKAGEVLFDVTPVVVATSAPQFRCQLTLDYETSKTLSAGHHFVKARPLAPAYDVNLPFLERVEGSGANVMTNFVDLSIPLLWPGPHWSHPALDGVRTLRHLSERFYELQVASLRGLQITGLEEALPEVYECNGGDVEPLPAVRRKRPRKELRLREFYSGLPRDKVTLVAVGRVYLITGENGTSVALFDSALTDNAIRIYSNWTDAIAWARGGTARATLCEKGPAPQVRIPHDPPGLWKEKLVQFFAATFGPSHAAQVRMLLCPAAVPVSPVPVPT